jgi:anthranilate phosphoribosyltransferase
MSNVFRDLLRKVGSGAHTGKDLTREEAAIATEMMLRQEATPAQIGAFMIAHRIKRPTPEELAGMLDAYDRLGPKLEPIAAQYPPLVLGIPYDGRSRTASISPLTTLIVAAAGFPVILHGGRRMPTKEGIPLVELWQGLGVDWTPLSQAQSQAVFAQTRVGFVYLPQHFPLAEALVPYREQIGKRPPFATVELFWCPYNGDALIVSGFVHPPTEGMARGAFSLRGTRRFITVKGLEGSCDLPRDRTCIIGIQQPDAEFQHLMLHPRDYGFDGAEVPLETEAQLIAALQSVLAGQPSELMEAAVWNGGFYLWRSGCYPSLEAGLEAARTSLVSGQAAQQLADIQKAVGAIGQETGKDFAGASWGRQG